jgi:hypothetical protein
MAAERAARFRFRVGGHHRRGLLRVLRRGRGLAAVGAARRHRHDLATGLRDVRVAPQTIPWSAIKSISTWQMQRQMVLVVAVDPAVEQYLTLTRVAQWMRAANRRIGADGLVISAHGLKIGYPTLFYTCRDYWEASRNST